MQEALAAHFVRRGLLRPAECAGRGLALRPAGSALPQRAIINLNKDGARPFGRAFVLVRAMWGWWRRAFLRVFCNRRPLHADLGRNIGIYRCFLRMMGGAMGGQRLICRDIRGLWHVSWRPKLSGMLNTPKNARRLEGDLREKGNRPVEVCIRRGGLCIYPIKDTLRIC